MAFEMALRSAKYIKLKSHLQSKLGRLLSDGSYIQSDIGPLDPPLIKIKILKKVVLGRR